MAHQRIEHHAGDRRSQDAGTEMPARIQIPLYPFHGPQDRQLIGRTWPQPGPGAFEVGVLELGNTAHRPLHQPGDFRKGGGHIEALVFGGTADQDFAVVLLRQVAITGSQAAVKQLGHTLGQYNLTFDRRHGDAQVSGHYAEFSCPGASGVDQGFAVERALVIGAHADHLAALAHHLGNVGVEVQVDTILPGTFGVGIGQAERADLVIAQKLQRTPGIVTDSGLRFTQRRLIEPAHFIGQMRDIGNNMLGVQAVFIVINHVLEPGALELEIHAVLFQHFLVQAGVQGIGLQGKVEETIGQYMRCTGVDNHCRTLGFTLAFGGHHAEKNHPATQPHRLADGP